MWNNVPNLLTLARLGLVIPIALLLMGGFWGQFFAFVLYVVAAGTDYLDGWWARTHNAGSDFGRMLDPIVDKILVASLLVMLAANHTLGPIGLICTIVILAREFLVAGAREFLGARGTIIPVSHLAKWKTTAQLVAVGLLIPPVPFVQGLGLLVLLAATVLTVLTAVEYLRDLRFSPE